MRVEEEESLLSTERSGKASLRRWPLSKDKMEVRAIRIYRRRALQQGQSLCEEKTGSQCG